jgi:hypothetical protein
MTCESVEDKLSLLSHVRNEVRTAYFFSLMNFPGPLVIIMFVVAFTLYHHPSPHVSLLLNGECHYFLFETET